MRRRPAPGSTGAVVVSALLLLAGCSGPVSLDAPRLTGRDASACRALIGALPDKVADLPRTEADAGAGYGAAWGDPPIELRCGVQRPEGLDAVAQCQTVNGVDWYIPESQQSGRPQPITMTTVGRAQYVEVRIPADYFPPATTMVDLGPAVKQAIREVKPCV